MQMHLIFGTAASLVGATVVFGWRVRETQKPVSLRSIMIPPIGMSTGFSMFVVPAMRVPLSWAVSALLAGALLLSVPLTYTSKLERIGEDIMMRRSRAFFAVLIVLVALRFFLREYIDHFISPLQTAALFYLLAFGMIANWRVRLLVQYRALQVPASEKN